LRPRAPRDGRSRSSAKAIFARASRGRAAKARDRRTFAWASSPAFLWDEATTKAGVRCRSLYPREALPAWKAATEDLLYSVETYAEMLAPYPFPEATNVNGPTSGMEYPGIVFCSERKDEEQLWLVTTHEIGHAWFPMLVGTDERRHAWMDEGFNTFVNYLANERRFPDARPKGPFRGLLSGWFEHVAFRERMLDPNRRPCAVPPDRMPTSQVGWTQYAIPAVGLAYLRDEILGPERFDAAFRDYVAKWSFKAPQPSDFFRCMENAAGADLSWFWRGWFLEAGVVDQEAYLVEKRPGGGVVFGFRNRGMPTPITVRATWSDGSEETFKIPVEAFAVEHEVERLFSPAGRRRVVSVRVDPERRAPDVRRDNDEAFAEESGRAGGGG
jgi:aminopeptidase N